MTAFAVEAEREAWIKMLMNVNEAPKNLLRARIRDLVGLVSGLIRLLGVPTEDFDLCLQGSIPVNEGS